MTPNQPPDSEHALQASTPNSGVTPSPAGGRGGWGSRSSRKKKALSMRECTSIVDGLKIIYFSKVCACSLAWISKALVTLHTLI